MVPAGGRQPPHGIPPLIPDHAAHVRPSSNNRQNLICHTYMLASCHLYTSHMIPSCRVHCLCVLSIQYLSSSHVLATIKI